ncbi:MAG TPA: glycosyltransferase family 2 protein [Bryobacteraceae bacterium]|nr:glycosyltransferase family 2 protein [Bryobacteraceae bacterium]
MITVVITTRNDERTIMECLSSLVPQTAGSGHEIVVLDDASADRTAAIVKEKYPAVRLIAEPRHVGWVVILRRYISELRGDAVAFLGSHCTADPDWLRTAESLLDSGSQVASGFGRHGRGRWLDRFEALSMHAEYLRHQPGEVSILWDDNFLIRRDLLARALPATSVALSDGTGATLLSRCLHGMGEALPYRPELRITHAGTSVKAQFRTWSRDMARNAIDIRRADATMPLAGALSWGPVAAFPIAAGRWIHGLKGMIGSRRDLGVGFAELFLHGLLFTLIMAAYGGGLLRELMSREVPGEPDLSA